jgi:chromosome segregation ATPase
LDEQLKRKRAPKNRLEEQLDVLTHRLESLEAERVRWEQQAGHLEEVAEAERVKVAQLKKKLEIAESGPDKLTKKEVNFWRAKAETIDAQIKEYQERLATLRRELNERDALIENLQASATGAAAAAAPAAPSADADELRRQLEQRDQWLAELRLELHELRGQPAPPLETQAEVETLRGQIEGLERALAEAHNMRAALQGDLTRAEQEIATRERATRETATAQERMRATLAEREHRISELSAKLEHLHHDLRQRAEQERASSTRYEEQIAALTRETEALRSRIDHDRHDAGSARAALELALQEREQALEKHRRLLAANERDFDELRRQLAEREHVAAEAGAEVERQRRAVEERERKLENVERQLHGLREVLAERDRQLVGSAGELEQARATLTANERDVTSMRETLHATTRELERARATLTANEQDLASLRETLGASSRDLAELRSEKERIEAALTDADARAAHAEARVADAEARATNAEARVAEAQARAAEAAGAIEAAREQIAGLESELKDERERAEDLSELANERREHMTKLEEQVEEAEERYADANWRLGKSLYFERIVRRRKGLILKLLEALRAKMKANVALKAGLDGLRTFKQTAEVNQHKLLQRIDGLKAELKEAEETIKRYQGSTAAKEELTQAISRATALEERLNTQAELIQSLEADLKTARLSHKAGDDKQQEIERLAKELEAKNQIIDRLQADADEQQRKLSKLRGSESETMRLKALTEKDRSEIDALQREVTQLRETLARQSVAPASGNNSELEAKLKERENSVTRLMGTIKEHEATIKKLTESAESWKRKYQFLATDQPDAYKHAVVEK